VSEKTVVELVQLLDRQSRDLQLLCEQNTRLMDYIEQLEGGSKRPEGQRVEVV
jgi:hypothetical protein